MHLTTHELIVQTVVVYVLPLHPSAPTPRQAGVARRGDSREGIGTPTRHNTRTGGGRSAKLWQLYEERYREIARSAEEQFLGEVGADFREAYENQRRD